MTRNSEILRSRYTISWLCVATYSLRRIHHCLGDTRQYLCRTSNTSGCRTDSYPYECMRRLSMLSHRI
eukprot:COSAG02_NODE_43038_length_378_cov_1.584229_2_plen_67_part_01